MIWFLRKSNCTPGVFFYKLPISVTACECFACTLTQHRIEGGCFWNLAPLHWRKPNPKHRIVKTTEQRTCIGIGHKHMTPFLSGMVPRLPHWINQASKNCMQRENVPHSLCMLKMQVWWEGTRIVTHSSHAQNRGNCRKISFLGMNIAKYSCPETEAVCVKYQ